jgi:hypothetical protein
MAFAPATAYADAEPQTNRESVNRMDGSQVEARNPLLIRGS